MIIIIFSSILLVSFCEDLPNTLPEFKKEISVVGILDTSHQPQKIYAFYTARLSEDPESIHNALVEISSGIQKVQFNIGVDTLYTAPQPSIRYYYTDRPETLQVIPEMKYHLRLVTAEGDSVMGETIVPGKFHIITPEPTSKVDTNLVIVWTSSKGAYGYVINVIHPPYEYEYPPGSGQYHYYSSYPESYPTVDTTYSIYNRYSFRPGTYVIKVLAYDQNYHYHHAEAISSCGVIGGYGVFGSGVIDSVAFTIE
jgi:hypothetical protein